MFDKTVRLILIISFPLFNACIASGETRNLSLDQCLVTAYKNNKTLLRLEEKINSAGYKIEEARSGFFPHLSFSGRYTRLGKVPGYESPGMTIMLDSMRLQFPPTKIAIGSADNYNFGLSLQQPLFTWGRIRNSYDISKHGLALAREEYRKNKQEIKFDVVSLILNILLAKELIKVREESIARIEDHLQTLQERYDKGYASEFDVLRAKVQLSNAKPPLVQAKNLYQLTVDNLKNVLGIDLKDSVNIEGGLEFAPFEVDQSQAEDFAFKNRSELKLIEDQRRIGKRALAIAKANDKPSLLGIANYEYKKPYYSENKFKTDWNFTLTLSMPIFDGFSTRSKVRQAKSDLKQLDVTEKQIEDLIQLEINQAILNLNLARENILSQQENVNQAKESIRIAKAQYEKGVLTNLELMDTEFALTVAETNYLQALSDYLIAKAKYEKAIGKD